MAKCMKCADWIKLKNKRICLLGKWYVGQGMRWYPFLCSWILSRCCLTLRQAVFFLIKTTDPPTDNKFTPWQLYVHDILLFWKSLWKYQKISYYIGRADYCFSFTCQVQDRTLTDGRYFAHPFCLKSWPSEVAIKQDRRWRGECEHRGSALTHKRWARTDCFHVDQVVPVRNWNCAC